MNEALIKFDIDSHHVEGGLGLFFTVALPQDYMLCCNVKYYNLFLDITEIIKKHYTLQTLLLQNIVKKVFFGSPAEILEMNKIVFEKWSFLEESTEVPIKYNYLQVKFVCGINFSKKDEDFLESLLMDVETRFYGHVLLENKYLAEKEFKKFSKEIQERIKSESIYLIYDRITKRSF